MDPQHQTENLHENDLAEFLRNFGDFWRRHGNTVLTVAVVLALAFAAYRFLTFRWTEQHETAWSDVAFATSPEGYREVAQAHGNPTVQALAYLRGGDLYLAQALAPDQPQPDGETEDAAAQPPADPAELLEQAREMYSRALEAAPEPIFRLNALLGLASVAESQGRWDDAERAYQQVLEIAGDDYSVIAQQAQARLGMLGDLQNPLPFAPEPPPQAQTPVETEGEAALPSLPGLDRPIDLSPSIDFSTPAEPAAPADEPAAQP